MPKSKSASDGKIIPPVHPDISFAFFEVEQVFTLAEERLTLLHPVVKELLNRGHRQRQIAVTLRNLADEIEGLKGVLE
jgi:hypothetical protein